MSDNIKIKHNASKEELNNRQNLLYLMKQNPLPDDEKLMNLGLFLKRQELTRFLFLNELYQKILNVHGNILEFGCRWGQNLVMFNNLRGIYEPYSSNRKIIGFDTFEGFKDIVKEDGEHNICKSGNYSVTEEYEKYLIQLLRIHELECPVSHLNKNTIIKGDVLETLPQYLKDFPETLLALVYFDMDVYKPTHKALGLIIDHLVGGAVLVFDQLNYSTFPGETQAVKDLFELHATNIIHSRFANNQGYFVWGKI